MKIVNWLTLKNMLINKKRTIMCIISVSLVCMLMYLTCLGFSSYRNNQIDSIKSYYGDYHLQLKDIDYNNKMYLNGVSNTLIVQSKFEMQQKSYKNSFIEVNDNYLNGIKLLSGELPKKSNEILVSKNDPNYGDITNGNIVTITNHDETYDYKIVGKYLSLPINNTRNGNIYVISYRESFEGNVDFYVTCNDISNCTQKGYQIAQNMGSECSIVNGIMACNNLSFNDDLLAMYGYSSNYAGNAVMILLIMLITFIIGCFSVFVIYNSFAISVVERKKMIGVLSSVGASSLQIIISVFLEGLIIYVIANIIGFCLALGIMQLFLGLFEKLLNLSNLKLTIYPLFMFISIGISAVTVFFASFSAALRASEISPIEAINLTDDIKIKKKKLRNNRLVAKLFGIEGALAIKNIKRNNKKYRITLVSLIVGTIILVCFYTFSKNTLDSFTDYSEEPIADITINVSTNDYADVIRINDFVNKIPAIDEMGSYCLKSKMVKIADYLFDENYLKHISNYFHEYTFVEFIFVTRDDYDQYKKDLSLSNDVPILVNTIKSSYSVDDKYVNYDGPIFDSNNISIQLLKIVNQDIINEELLENVYVTTIQPHFLINDNIINVILPIDMFDNINENFKPSYKYNNQIVINSTNWRDFEHSFFGDYYNNGNIQSDLSLEEIFNVQGNYSNNIRAIEEASNRLLVIKICIYTFGGLILSIGVSSMINTIIVNLHMRRKEFAMLRSIGMNDKSFNKMIRFESLFFSLKAILYGNIIGIGITYLFYRIIYFGEKLSDYSIKFHFRFPFEAMIFSSTILLFITLLIMFVSTKRTRKDSIIEVLKTDVY